MEHEIIDQLDAQGAVIGTVDKAIAHRDGLWHRAVHVWIVNSKGQMLFQKRCADKKFFPNFWDCSFAGHIGAGEDSRTAAVREGAEEIGLAVDPNELQFLFTIKEQFKWKDIQSNEFVDVYLLHKDFDERDLVFQKEEVAGAKFFDLNWFYFHTQDKDFLPHHVEYQRLKEHVFKPLRRKPFPVKIGSNTLQRKTLHENF